MFLFRFSLLFFSLLFLNSCSGNKRIESILAPDPKLKENTTTVTPNVNTNVDNISTPNQSINNANQNLSVDIPIYSPSELIKTEGNKKTLKSSSNINVIYNFYQEELKTKKWVISQEEENLLIAVNPNDNKQLKLTFYPSENINEFTIEYPWIDDKKPIIVNNNQNNSQPPENKENPIIKVENNNYLQDLITLNIIKENQANLNPNRIITKREYAKLLITANNIFYKDSPSKQIRIAGEISQPVFSDINKNDPNFAEIQGLAEAGLIPSSLTKNAQALTFRADEPLTREDLISWKVPLDIRKSLPFTSLDSIKETWGFKDATDINPNIWTFLYLDWQNGDRSNIRRAFGYTTLFQPKKPVTLAEVATVLWYFGYQNESISAQDLLKR